MDEPNELAAAQAERDAEELETRGIARIPWGLIVNSDESAEQVIAGIQLRRDSAARERAQVEKRAQRAERDADRYEEHFRGQLVAYTLAQLAATSATTKHIKLVTGQGGDKPTQMGFRMVPGGLRIVDAEQALDWGGDQEDELKFVKVTTAYKPIAAAFKQHYAETGEIPPGTEFVDDKETFYIK